ncbi:hypothetical protein OHB56_21140 [Streptomyces sp. NBC_01635]|uniref:hypothetical protein n=1 Tax=Streptomyces sp. NBC_01635 TaxID=2975904 RepID=UPI00386458CB|nr:hypothetical protein OHB56_21140 [Streptomyces sp. NBC_01635]
MTAPEPSRTAGACVLAVLGGAALAVVFALSSEAGVLTVWAVGVTAVWRAARRPVSDSSAPPPPGEDRPSCSECAGHDFVSVTPSETQKGMLIYKTSPPDRPNHTHIHFVEGEVNQA